MLHILAGFNILLGMAGFGWLLVRTVGRQHEYPTEVFLLLLLTLALFFGLLVTSLEMFSRDFESYSSVAITGVKVFALFVLIRHRNTLFRTGARTEGNGDSTRPDRDI